MHDTEDERRARVDGALDVFSSPLLAVRALAGLPETAKSLIIDPAVMPPRHPSPRLDGLLPTIILARTSWGWPAAPEA